MKRAWMLVLVLSFLGVGCRTGDGVVTIKAGGEKKVPGGEALWEEACEHATTLMRTALDDLLPAKADEVATDLRRECKIELQRYGKEEADEMARCVLEINDVREFSKCEPGKGDSGE
ncbi:MAG: hypothetical protein ABIK09_19035 [Pseudomonadota bacterium]